MHIIAPLFLCYNADMKKIWYGAILILVFANIMVWPYVLKAHLLRVTFFDVGQGDAIFIQTPQGHKMLIDGGPNNTVVEKISQQLPFWDKSIDLVVLTHPDADHITGLVGVFKQYEIKNVLWAGVEKETNIFAEWKEAALAEGANIWLANAPQVIFWSQTPLQENISVLYASAKAKEVNDTSVVAKLRYGAQSFLFPGDIGRMTEQEMVELGIPLKADVLKVPHHGSKTSSSANFLAMVNPQIGVIQVGGNNRYGHPVQEVLSRFSDFGISILRTDQEGDIIIQTNGNSLEFRHNL